MSQDISDGVDSFQQLFQTGLSSLQQKKWDQALTDFQKILDLSRASSDNQPSNKLTPKQASAVYHNMSLASSQNNDVLHAYIWSKKSITLEPGNKLALDNFKILSEKVQLPQINHDISAYEHLHKMGLNYIPLDLLLMVMILSALLGLYRLSNYFLERKKHFIALESEGPTKKPTLPITSFILLPIAILALFFSTLKWQDLNKTKAMVISDLANLQTAPGENQAVILQLKAATELEVLKTHGEFTQVHYPGAFTGWVITKDLEVLNSVN